MKHAPEQEFHDDEKYLSGLDGAPRVILRNNKLSPQARLLYSYINSFAISAKQGCFVSNGRFAYYIGCSRRTIQRYIRELVGAGVIESFSLPNGNRQIVITGRLVIGNEPTHDTDVIPPATPTSRPHDDNVTLGMDKGIDLRINKAPTGAVCEVDSKKEEQFKRFYDAYDPKARYGDKREDVRRQWDKTLAEGISPEEIIEGVERKKKRLEAFRRDTRNGFESNFPYPLKFLRRQLWRTVGTTHEPKKQKNAEGFSRIDRRFPKIPPSFLGDLKKLKATDEQLKELNEHWDFWQARRLNEDGMTDELLLKAVQQALDE